MRTGLGTWKGTRTGTRTDTDAGRHGDEGALFEMGIDDSDVGGEAARRLLRAWAGAVAAPVRFTG